MCIIPNLNFGVLRVTRLASTFVHVKYSDHFHIDLLKKISLEVDACMPFECGGCGVYIDFH